MVCVSPTRCEGRGCKCTRRRLQKLNTQSSGAGEWWIELRAAHLAGLAPVPRQTQRTLVPALVRWELPTNTRFAQLTARHRCQNSAKMSVDDLHAAGAPKPLPASPASTCPGTCRHYHARLATCCMHMAPVPCRSAMGSFV